MTSEKSQFLICDRLTDREKFQVPVAGCVCEWGAAN